MAVVIETTLGDITVDLFLKQRPVTCLNFLKLCKMKYYNFNLFHSIRSGFIAQTGDPTGEGTGGESIWGILEGPKKRFFSGEKMPKIRHTDAGLLSMVCSGDMMIGSQFFFTLAPDLDSLDGQHCVIGEVTEGHDVLRKLNEVICDESHRPYRDVRITHTVVLEDPFNDPAGLRGPSRSPSPSAERLKGGRIAPDEEIDETQGKSMAEVQEIIEEKEAKARATILEIIGDLPDADIAPPENVLFVCKLNPVTTDEDLEIIFSRFGKIVSCEVIRDKKTGDSLQYAFIEFADKKSCEDAYFKMDNVLIDDRRIHVDFSQSVSKMKWLGKGRGVKHFTDDEIKQNNNHTKNKRAHSRQCDSDYRKERFHNKDREDHKRHTYRDRQNDREDRYNDKEREKRRKDDKHDDKMQKNSSRDKEIRLKESSRKEIRNSNDREVHLGNKSQTTERDKTISKKSKISPERLSKDKNDVNKYREYELKDRRSENKSDKYVESRRREDERERRSDKETDPKKNLTEKESGRNLEGSRSRQENNNQDEIKRNIHNRQVETQNIAKRENNDKHQTNKHSKSQSSKQKEENNIDCDPPIRNRNKQREGDELKPLESKTPSPSPIKKTKDQLQNKKASKIAKTNEKTAKTRTLKKRRKSSTSSTDSDSSESSSSSSSSSSTSEDDRRKRTKNRKYSTSSTSSSSSTTSSTSTTSSDSSSSDSEPKKKKTKNSKRKSKSSIKKK